MISERLKQQYLDDGGIACLYCSSENISPGRPQSDVNGDFCCYVDCLDCGQHWFDVLKLADVVEE
jgi:hypothetical protein